MIELELLGPDLDLSEPDFEYITLDESPLKACIAGKVETYCYTPGSPEVPLYRPTEQSFAVHMQLHRDRLPEDHEFSVSRILEYLHIEPVGKAKDEEGGTHYLYVSKAFPDDLYVSVLDNIVSVSPHKTVLPVEWEVAPLAMDDEDVDRIIEHRRSLAIVLDALAYSTVDLIGVLGQHELVRESFGIMPEPWSKACDMFEAP